jgi:Lar family restriction alleviation protein
MHMKRNTKNKNLTEKLFNMKIGSILRLKTNESDEGSFLKVPSGWIYRYTSRNMLTSCFVPYSEDVAYWDLDLEINSCPFCGSTDVILQTNNSIGEHKGWFIKCNACNARSSERVNQADTIKIWNKFNKKSIRK